MKTHNVEAQVIYIYIYTSPQQIPKSTECYWDVNLILCKSKREMTASVQENKSKQVPKKFRPTNKMSPFSKTNNSKLKN